MTHSQTHGAAAHELDGAAGTTNKPVETSKSEGSERSDAHAFWESHVPALLTRGRDTTVPELDVEACFHLLGPGGGEWTVRIERGRVESVERGSGVSPTVTITLSADEFVSIARGESDHREAFFSGRIQVDGDLELLLWCASLIPVLRERFPFDPAAYRSTRP